jgi:hypothetical protein
MREKIAALGLISNDTPTIDDMRAYIQAARLKWGTMGRQLGLEGSH